jgi:hypothetical protein
MEAGHGFPATLAERPAPGTASTLLVAVEGGVAMSIRTLRCPVLGGTVTQVTDLEGAPLSIICPEYDRPTGECRVKNRAAGGGPLAQFLERVAEETLTTRSRLCDLQ